MTASDAYVGAAALGHNGDREIAGPPAPSAAHAALLGSFASLLGLAARSGARREVGRLSVEEIVCVGLASHDIARIVARDRITTFLRSPFASGEAAQYPRGQGLRRAIGELLTCPHCLSLWAAAGLTAARLRYPREARVVAAAFAAHSVAGLYESVAVRRVWR